MQQPGEGKNGIFVPARFIPTPVSVSPQAQAFLSSPPPVQQTSAPDLEDKAGWRAYAEEVNRGLTAFTALQAGDHPAEITTHQMSAASLYEVTRTACRPATTGSPSSTFTAAASSPAAARRRLTPPRRSLTSPGCEPTHPTTACRQITRSRPP
jgi:hypothetical protein